MRERRVLFLADLVHRVEQDTLGKGTKKLLKLNPQPTAKPPNRGNTQSKTQKMEGFDYVNMRPKNDKITTPDNPML